MYIYIYIQVVSGVDIMVVRELTGDVYFGEPKGITTKVYNDMYTYMLCVSYIYIHTVIYIHSLCMCI
jgi:isocitrate/isopropylmalate dehydrogenase